MSEQIFDSLCHPQYENYVRSNLPTHSPKYRDLTACNLYMSTRKGRGKKEIFLYYFELIKGYCRAILLLVLQQNGTGKGNYLYSNEKQNMSNPHEQSFVYN